MAFTVICIDRLELKQPRFSVSIIITPRIALGLNNLILARAKICDLYLLIVTHIIGLTCNEHLRFIHNRYKVREFKYSINVVLNK